MHEFSSKSVKFSPQLKRAFSLTGAVVMSAGLVIGVGLFTVSTNAIGYLGPLLLIGISAGF